MFYSSGKKTGSKEIGKQSRNTFTRNQRTKLFALIDYSTFPRWAFGVFFVDVLGLCVPCVCVCVWWCSCHCRLSESKQQRDETRWDDGDGRHNFNNTQSGGALLFVVVLVVVVCAWLLVQSARACHISFFCFFFDGSSLLREWCERAAFLNTKCRTPTDTHETHVS